MSPSARSWLFNRSQLLYYGDDNIISSLLWPQVDSSRFLPSQFSVYTSNMSDNKRKSNINNKKSDGGDGKGKAAKKGNGDKGLAAMSLSDVWAEQQGKLRDIEERFASLFDAFQDLTVKQNENQRLLLLHASWLQNLDPLMSKAPLALQKFRKEHERELQEQEKELENKKKEAEEEDTSNGNN